MNLHETPSPAQHLVLSNILMGREPNAHVSGKTQAGAWTSTWLSLKRRGWVTAEGAITADGLGAMGVPGAAATTEGSVLADLSQRGPATQTILRIRMNTYEPLLQRCLYALCADARIALEDGWYVSPTPVRQFPRTTWRFPS